MSESNSNNCSGCETENIPISDCSLEDKEVITFDCNQFDTLRQEILDIISTYEGIKGLWKSLDFNGNNIVSLAEIDKFIVERFPLLNHKPALMRAYKKTTLKDGDGDCWVEKKEFRALLSNLFYFNKLFQAFKLIDDDNDRRLDLKEFTDSCFLLGLNYSNKEAESEFNEIDQNKGGIVLFDEFCEWYTNKNELNGIEADAEDPNDFGRNQ